MKRRALLVSVVATAGIVVPVADALRIAPLADQRGVVLTWRASNATALVAQPNGNIITIHSLRRFEPGTQVSVQGIKWGKPTQGIKWGTRPQGIKWGIKWGRNGTYQSGLRKRGSRKAVWTPVQGPIVKKFGRKAVAIGTKGGLVVVRLAVRAITNSTTAGDGLPPVGATVSMRVYFTANGLRVGRNLRYLKPPVPGASVPFGGDVVSIDPNTRTMVVGDDQDPAYPVRIQVALPAGFVTTPFGAATPVAVEGIPSPDGSVDATLVGDNTSFTAADDPARIQVATDGQPACANAVLAACPPVALLPESATSP